MITLDTGFLGRGCGALLLAATLVTQGLAQDTAVHKAETASGGVDALMQQGEALYGVHCGACHQPNGQGLAGAFPPLAESDYLMKDRTRAIATVIQGLSVVKGSMKCKLRKAPYIVGQSNDARQFDVIGHETDDTSKFG